MRVLVLEPGYCPYIAFFDSAEEAVKKIIQGEKNVALPFGNEVIALVSSEEQDSLAEKTSAYYVDDNLAAKFGDLFEKPSKEEIDVWVKQ